MWGYFDFSFFHYSGGPDTFYRLYIPMLDNNLCHCLDSGEQNRKFMVWGYFDSPKKFWPRCGLPQISNIKLAAITLIYTYLESRDFPDSNSTTFDTIR